MKYHLVLLASLFALSGGSLAESTAKEQPAAARKKQPKKSAAVAEAKPKAEESTTAGGMPQSFVIPSNTCEQGTPLQKLLRDKPK